MLKPKVLRQFEKLEQSRLKLHEELDHCEFHTLQFRPSPEKWNTLQIIFHLINAERNSVLYISKKKLGGASVPKATWINSAKSAALAIALRFLKWKAPQVLQNPPSDLEYTQLRHDWNTVREQMKLLLNEMPEDMLDRTIFRQPIAGLLNIPQALKFMQHHFNHHLKQIDERIRNASVKNYQ